MNMKILKEIIYVMGDPTTIFTLLISFSPASLAGPKWLIFHTIVFFGHIAILFVLGNVCANADKESD